MNKKDSLSISIICPSPKGIEIAIKLQKALNATLYIKKNYYDLEKSNEDFERKNEETFNVEENNIYEYGENFKLSDITKKAMKNSSGIIFISSTGIAVRAIAPFLEGKDRDPGIVVVDLSLRYAINILSGHLGGGNELTIKASEVLDVMPIITTASDNLGIIAPDVLAKENNLIIEDLKKAKYIATQLIDNRIIGIKDDFNMIEISKGYEKVQDLRENCIWITHKLQETSKNDLDHSKILRLIKRDLILGIGCRRSTPFEKINDFIRRSLLKFNFDISAVKSIVSIDVKANEEGIIKLASSLNCTFKTFSRDQVRTVQDKFDKSEFVLKTLGVTGVCEPCVDLAGADVIISKIKHEGITLAIGVLNRI